ncbi:MAG: hypothetical protein R3B06_29440 [Kofleriaceae bacterium]
MTNLGRAGLYSILVALAAGAGPGCGRSSTHRKADDAAVADAGPPPAVPVAVRALGAASLDGFGWRTGPGAASFARALAAEKAGDLGGVEREAGAALAADPGHLEAAWLVAVARARLGRPDEVLAPLEIAAAGDWPKWGERSLTLAALADFRATPTGRGWVDAADAYRRALAASMARAVVVIGARAGRAGGVGREVYAVDLDLGRWLRLTRTGGAVVGALRAPDAALLAYAAVSRTGAGGARQVAIGVLDLATGRTSREVSVADVRNLELGWRTRNGELLLEAHAPGRRGATAGYLIDWRRGKRAGIAKPARLRGDRLVISATGAERRHLPLAGITADWDDRGTASAVRVDRTGKIIAEPAGGLIDGESVALSPDRARLVFATALEAPCDDRDARRLVVAEVATGRVRPVATGAVAAPVWLDDDRLAYVDGPAVKVISVGAAQVLGVVAGGAGVVTPAVGPRRRCDAEPPPFAAPVVDEPEAGDDADDPALTLEADAAVDADAGGGPDPAPDGGVPGPDAAPPR